MIQNMQIIRHMVLSVGFFSHVEKENIGKAYVAFLFW